MLFFAVSSIPPFVGKKLGPTHLLNQALPRKYTCHGDVHQFSIDHDHVHFFFSKGGHRIIRKLQRNCYR